MTANPEGQVRHFWVVEKYATACVVSGFYTPQTIKETYVDGSFVITTVSADVNCKPCLEVFNASPAAPG